MSQEDNVTETPVPQPDAAPENTPPPEGAAPPDPTPEAKTYDADYVEKLRKENARYRTEAKTGADAARRLKEIEDRDLSDLEKAKRDAEEATSRLAHYEVTNLRQRVALDKGLPPSLVGRLQGTTEEEIAADADALMALIKSPTSPRPDPSQGARATSPDDELAAEYERYYPTPTRK